MKGNLLGLVAFSLGAILIYAAVKNQNPVDIIKAGLKGQVLRGGTIQRGTGTVGGKRVSEGGKGSGRSTADTTPIGKATATPKTAAQAYYEGRV